MKTHIVHFQGAFGDRLAARVDLPVGGDPVAWALFAHCFTCSKNLRPVVNLSRALNQAGVGVLRFDFTGLGTSEGDFSDTDFTSNVDDLVAAARYMAEAWSAPQLLIGHSLGGAAVIRAALALPSVRAVATIGAPSDPAHVLGHMEGALEELKANGEALVSIGGRPFRVRQNFVDDISEARLDEAVRSLGRPLLVLHAPDDEVVAVSHAGKIFEAARHPRSFVALDGADHLLMDPAHSRYAARVIAAWASRYLGLDVEGADSEGGTLDAAKAAGEGDAEAPGAPRAHVAADSGEVAVATGPTGYRTEAGVRGHRFVLDEPEHLGGTDEGPTPYEMLWASLAACTSITLRMYADRKSWPLEEVHVRIRHRKEAGKDHVVRELSLEGDLDEEQRQRLVEIADRCPVHRTLERGVEVSTELV
ncbi:bifunctional alpha/beta hydrolase/OsmC family protein [soil metagenome]